MVEQGIQRLGRSYLKFYDLRSFGLCFPTHCTQLIIVLHYARASVLGFTIERSVMATANSSQPQQGSLTHALTAYTHSERKRIREKA